MPELRKDPIVGRWVIISTERAKRPRDFAKEEKIERQGDCPFCYGKEDKTPPEILAYRPQGSMPNTSGWTIRVVPNKFPALKIEEDLEREGEGVFDKMSGVGAHEVIIESPRHDATFSTLSEKEVEEEKEGGCGHNYRNYYPQNI